MKLKGLSGLLPSWQNALLAVLSALLLILAFPPFEWWLTAWFALVPLLWALEREKASLFRSFALGWLFGNIFFFGTCWWLTFAPITYAKFPPILAYLLLFCVTAVVGIFPGIFATLFTVLFRRFGISWALLFCPFIWVSTEFLRYWITGNNWNAIGYSQAFGEFVPHMAEIGGVLLVGFVCLVLNAAFRYSLIERRNPTGLAAAIAGIVIMGTLALALYLLNDPAESKNPVARVVAVQPNVPMAGLDQEKWRDLRRRHEQLAMQRLEASSDLPTTVVFPESPMNFMYEDEPETKEFINSFAAKHDVSVLFNSAEPDLSNGKYFNSAVLVGPEGREVVQYDKIYLVPFGEAVPFPLEGILPGFVGNFSYGREYDLLPLGDAKAGVMICFESHFGQLSREYVRNGADVIIEMTNDGYLGPTPVLRQHLANAVFRAIETNRPVLRVTNVGITAYVDERGQIRDAAESYVEDTRVWTVSRSDGSQTFYVKFGDWFAWFCSLLTLFFVGYSLFRRPIIEQG